jgi:ATP-dependent Lon protease
MAEKTSSLLTGRIVVPVLPTRNVVLFPGCTVPLTVGRRKSIAAVERAREGEGWLLSLAQRVDTEKREPTHAELFRVGTLCHIEGMRGSPESGYQVVLRGVHRVRVLDLADRDRFLSAEVEVLGDVFDADEKTAAALLRTIKQLAHELLELVPADTRQLSLMVDAIDDLVLLIHLCAENMDAPLEKKQAVLETASIKQRALLLLGEMQALKESLALQGEIREKLTQKMGKMQRETILREQLKTIREELGEEGEGKGSPSDYEKRIADAGMPEEALRVAREQAKRLESIGDSSPEAHVIRNYLDLLCAMPWNKSSPEEIDLGKARTILDTDHYGLEKIKKRIVQHLAVMKLKKNGRGSILLFVGPPGVGKTSLGKSIAKALGRVFTRASLGGVRDDAEIRGHRRTYIGALPGRIIQSIKRAGVNNPVFMLDEIDKLSRGYTGDPAAALLEVLDPEQNANFVDHYLDVAFDLSRVFFIGTANTLDSIPPALLDRMEVIELSGYTTAEKLHIAKNHLIPKELEEHGLSAAQLQITDEALLRITTHYTREAGVRELERRIAAVCRASTEKVLAPEAELPVKVDSGALEEILGTERFTPEVVERLVPPGVAVGLAWTPQGGDILFVEATLMPGTNQLTLTGQLGDVMKESAQIALSLVRSHLTTLIPGFDYDKKDVHIHVPAGAIPKDGPSAGVTMLTAIASLFSRRHVSPKLAMTGEITLRGAVTPVGGIKEKLIAAHRAGIEKVLLPRRNQRDLKEVPEEVKSQLQIELIDNVQDVLRSALGLTAQLLPAEVGVMPGAAKDQA